MESLISTHQLNQLIDYIIKKYTTFGAQQKNGKLVFDVLKNSSDLKLGHKKPIIPFRKILFPKLLEPQQGQDSSLKIALIGLNNCDVWSLHYLLEEFGETFTLPKREDILIIGSECFPNENCFCDLMGTNKIAPFDLHLQEHGDGYAIFAGSPVGKKILEKNGIKQTSKKLEINKIKPDGALIQQKKLSETIDDKEKFRDFWEKISQNCFGCGACSMVCPLCFCTRQDFKNELTGESKQCLNWDSCFAKRFSEIQNHYDFRPKNTDRLYNWYHHKFVRSYSESKRFLCTGCGRCIEACPANLNMKNIIQSIIKQDKKDN
ncbi:MAG: 4Fe-4S dicluster domain-containing protein [Patescibacteria group bacterium]|nr:4Fe-4S dicluster domain-containing protein [Patescibacteria group bacterium]